MKILNSIKYKIRQIKISSSHSFQKDVTILSNNCFAGILYHDLNKKFLSPTINLMISPDDLLFLADNIGYFNSDIIKTESNYKFPVGKLLTPKKEITILFNHYSNFPVAKEKFHIRSKRISNNIFILLNVKKLNDDLAYKFKKIKFKKLCIYEINNCHLELNDDFVQMKDAIKFINIFSSKKNFDKLGFDIYFKIFSTR